MQKLKQQLTDIENKSDLNSGAPPLPYYPGSTGHGDSRKQMLASNAGSLVLYDNRSAQNNYTESDQSTYKITKKQHRNLQKIFKFYASQHQLASNVQYSFDEITDLQSKLR